jgi:hypothetical protein
MKGNNNFDEKIKIQKPKIYLYLSNSKISDQLISTEIRNKEDINESNNNNINNNSNKINNESNNDSIDKNENINYNDNKDENEKKANS